MIGRVWRTKPRDRLLLPVGAMLLGLTGCGGPVDPSPRAGPGDAATGRRIVAADREPQNWLSTGRNYQETRHSPLTQIDTATVGRLGLAWWVDLDTTRGQESTPIIVDGIVYTTSAWSKLQAIDGVTGKMLWQYDPQVPGAAAINACCDVVNRGAAYWEGKLYIGTIDGRLIAVNAKTGKPVWSTLTIDPKKPYSITGAPRVVKGKVLIGNGGGEYDMRGYIGAYDAETGRLAWRFYTVPGDPRHPDGAASDAILAKAAATWAPDSWQRTNGGGGGTVWDSMAYDPALDLLYVGVGNGGYHPQAYRSPKKDGNNDNLFLGSILALRPDTGEYVWHYQQTPGDQWDYTSTQHMILADLPIGGRMRKVLLQAPKNGFFYVIDRETGKPISAEPYTKVTWAKGVDLRTGRPIVNPDADYSRTGRPWVGFPSSTGGHNWQPMAFDPATGLVYIPMREAGQGWAVDPTFKPLPLGLNLGLDTSAMDLPDDKAALAAIRKSMKGYLIAWDPVRQREMWRVPLAGDWNGGVLSTAGGLVFQGDQDGRFSAYNAKTGRRLWSFDAHTAITAAPVAWSTGGRQYVTVVAGWGTSAALGFGALSWSASGPRVNHSRVLTFALDGTARLPDERSVARPAAPKPPAPVGDAAMIAKGKRVYNRTCFACHGIGAVSGGILPDLRASAALNSREGWSAIVADGALSDQGMVGFKANFSSAEIEAVRAFIVDRARRTAGADGQK